MSLAVPGNFMQSVGAWLGQLPRTEYDLAAYADEGLSTEVTKVMTQHGLTPGEVSSLIIPARTLKHRRSKDQRLSKDESDKAIRTARLLAKAEGVFGTDEMGLRWMRQAKRRFQGKTPLQMMETEAGARLVEDMLGQIEHGMFA